MSGIEKNRVFDSAAIEELKSQVLDLMQTAQDVTETVKGEVRTIIGIAADVPAEAKHPGLTEAAGTLLANIDTTIFDTLRARIVNKLDNLNAEIPAYDARSAAVLTQLSGAARGLMAMIDELKGMIGQGSLHMSLTEFTEKLQEYETKWEQGGLNLEAMMTLAMTYLKGLVAFSEYSKDPVNLSTGNFYYEKEDIMIRGRMPLAFKRHYNAMDKGGGILGQGWSHNLEEKITLAEGEAGTSLVLHMPDGQEIAFMPADAAQEKDSESVSHVREGIYRDIYTGKEEIHRTEEGLRYEKGGITHDFDANGRLKSRKDKDGNAILYIYDENDRLAKAEQAPAGGHLIFTYKEDGTLREIMDHTGRNVAFFHMEGRLTEVTDPEGSVTTYRYEENGRLRAIKNPRGILTVRNEYDEKGRIITQKFPDKGRMCYAYDERKNATILTERNGTTITYVQDEKLRNTQIIYHDSQESCTYNDRNQKTSHTDRNGNTTHYTYDDKGNITGIINALGIKTSLTYNAEGKLLSVKHAGKEIIKNSYDNTGRPVKIVDALGRIQENIYGESGLIRAVTAPDGSRTEFTHDDKGNITAITDPYGIQTIYRYDGLNRVIETTDGNGNVTRYRYDKKDRLIMVTNPEGNSRRYSYNPSGKVEKAEDFDGTVTTVAYNDLNKPECLTDKEGRQTKRRYDLMWNISEEISPTGAVTKFTYDADNRLSGVSLCMAEGEETVSVIRYTHDPAGNLTRTITCRAGEDTETGEDCIATSYEYDAMNRITASTDAAAGTTRYEYDETGKVQSVTDPAGNKISYIYNEAGELVKEMDSEGRTLSYEYNVLGQPVRITDSLGRETIHTYEKGGRLIKTTHPDGRSISYTYDNNGNIRAKENSDGYRLTYTYDCMNRVSEVTSSSGQKKSYGYDVMGNVTSMTDANGNTTLYEYTPGGKLAAVTDALGNRTQYRYDALDNLILIHRMGEKNEEAEHKTEYIRNPLGQVEAVRDAFGREERYTYDAFGRMKEKTDRDGLTTAFTYEPDGKTKSILYADGKSVEMEYDALRKLICVKDWLGITKIDRDMTGQIEAVTDHMGRKVSYSYGKTGERTGITYPDGRTVSYRYDEQLRLTEMRMPDESIITYYYDENGRLSEKCFPDGLRTLWHYSGTGELTELIHEDKDGILDRYEYEYDPMGNKTAITKQRRGLEKESGRYEYGYDALGRLATVTKDGEALRSYAYDPFGNRSEMEDHGAGRKTAYTYDALDRLTVRKEVRDGKESIREYLYDNRGNLTEETEEGRFLHGYSYNAMNRLERAWNAEGEEAVYRYNGLGQRIGKEVGERREDYLLDLTRPYHNLLGMVRGEDARNFYWDGNVAAMSERKTGEESLSVLHYYLQDELGSTVRVSGYHADNGKETRADIRYLTYGYDEFGNDLYDDPEENGIPNPYSRQGEEQPFGYTGYRYDDISGTYFAQAREYQEKNGRFINKDKEKYIYMGDRNSINLYLYCRNMPLNYTDDSGNEVIIVTGGIHDNAANQYMFVEPALKNVQDSISDGTPKEDITWLIINAGYTDEQMNNFQGTAENLGINYVVINDKTGFINYINDKDGGVTRAEDKITEMSFFCHGQCPRYSGTIENQLSFAYHVSNVEGENVNFTQSDIAKLNNNSFDNTTTIFYSCNAGTKDFNDRSFAQEWTNKTGGTSYGIVNGRTYYGAINKACNVGFYWSKDLLRITSVSFYPGDLWNTWFHTDLGKEKQRREDERAEKGYSESGSLNYPWLVSLSGDLDVLFSMGIFERGWKMFLPENQCIN